MAEYLCFGGPAHGRLLDVPYGCDRVAFMDTDLAYKNVSKLERILAHEHVYRLERLYYRKPLYKETTAYGYDTYDLSTTSYCVRVLVYIYGYEWDKWLVEELVGVSALSGLNWTWGGVKRVPGCECSDEMDDWGNGCLDGEWYGSCEDEDCYGFCEPRGKCPCICHV